MLPRIKFIDPTLPNSVALRLESMLYAAPLSTVAYALGLVVMSIAMWLRTGDIAMTSCAVAAVSLCALRVALVKLYRATSVYLATLLAFGIVYSALLAALVARAFSVGDPVAIALAVTAAAGYLSGVTIRAAAVPALAIPHASSLFGPLIVTAAVTRGSDYWAAAILLTFYWIGTVQLIRTMHDRIRSQLLAEEEMARAASTDPLTGLANRAAFDGALTQRLGTGAAAIVAMIDLDRFKPVNDTYGHDAGDELLRAVASRIVAELDHRHLVARLGGDEFAILFDEVLDVANATRAAERFVQALERPFPIAANSITVGASVGLATAVDGDNVRSLKRRADERLYDVKRSGRGHVSSEIAAAAAA
ncbi:GGDEF domain-containing protein [Bradyrhizobium sp. WYCCWR 12699]|uniref:GGDEF domain-containing protein n=1 Tax=Bradyrhizobium sp. WYCCWR 12699 TaxID=3064203 RepID=UPI0028B0D914|nr:GGDEF domain-containing protein [Bradyrhizobium sp. WYCCWR 12699]